MKRLPLSATNFFGAAFPLVAAAIALAGAPAAQAQTTPFPLGGYFNDPNGSDPSAEATFEGIYNSFSQLMGTTPQFLNYYIDQRQQVSDWPSNAGWIAWSGQQSPAKNVVPVVAFPIGSRASSESFDQQFKEFASGQYDTYIQQVVQQWQQHGFSTVYWRVGWEMNFNTSGSSPYANTDAATEADWVAAFQHVASVLRQAGNTYGVATKIVWNPGATNYDQTNTLANLYPGNSYVDIIAADIYADSYPYSVSYNSSLYYDWDKHDGTADTYPVWLADPVNRTHYWTYPAATEYSLDGSGGHNLSLTVLLNFAKAQGKPFAVPETGAGNSNGGHDVSDEAAFPQWLGQTLSGAGVPIAFVNIWDADADGNFLFSTSDANKPGEAAAWAANFGARSSTALSTAAWYTLTDQTTGSCVDANAWGTANGTLVQQWQCGQQANNEEWQFVPTDSGYYRIVNRNAPGEEIDVENEGTTNGYHVHLWQNYSLPNQQWMPVALGNGFYKFVGRGSGRCLDLPGASPNNGVQLQIYDCNGTGAQAWKLNVQP